MAPPWITGRGLDDVQGKIGLDLFQILVVAAAAEVDFVGAWLQVIGYLGHHSTAVQVGVAGTAVFGTVDEEHPLVLVGFIKLQPQTIDTHVVSGFCSGVCLDGVYAADNGVVLLEVLGADELCLFGHFVLEFGSWAVVQPQAVFTVPLSWCKGLVFVVKRAAGGGMEGTKGSLYVPAVCH